MSYSIRISRFFLAFSLIASLAHAASPPAGDWCERLLTQEFRAQRAKQPLLERAVITVFQRPIRARVRKACLQGCTETELARAVRDVISETAGRSRVVRGYGTLVGLMVGSAAASSHLTESLPHSTKFLALFVSQVSTIGVYVIGSPIWDRASSAFKRWAFGLSAGPETSAMTARPELEAQWARTQAVYSPNAQISRAVVNQFLIGARQNLESSLRAMLEGSRADAIDQLAELSIRMRRLFGDIDPSDRDVALAVKTGLLSPLERKDSTHLKDLKAEVLERIHQLDPEYDTPAARLHYEATLRAWLTIS